MVNREWSLRLLMPLADEAFPALELLQIRLIDDKGGDVPIDLIAELHLDAISITRTTTWKRNCGVSARADSDGLGDGLGDKHASNSHVGESQFARKK